MMTKRRLRLRQDVKCVLMGIVMVVCGIGGLYGLTASIGAPGDIAIEVLRFLVGRGAVAVCAILILMGLIYIILRVPVRPNHRFTGWGLLGYGLLLWLHRGIPAGRELYISEVGSRGGFIAGIGLLLLREAFGESGAMIVTGGLAAVAFLLATGITLKTIVKTLIFIIRALWRTWPGRTGAGGEGSSTRGFSLAAVAGYGRSRPDDRPKQLKDYGLTLPPAPAPAPELAEAQPNPDLVQFAAEKTEKPALHREQPQGAAEAPQPGRKLLRVAAEPGTYTLPPLSLLKKGNPGQSSRAQQEITETIHLLEDTLASFGVSAKVVHVSQGPAVTRYEVEPAAGVKVSRIVSLADDLALKLAAQDIRIEAPIPGKAAVGVEVPNRTVTAVYLRDVLETQEFQKESSRLAVALGRDVAGAPVVADLAKMPHLLVAGATGSGKSVCINTMIVSILYRARPNEVKFLLVDPKMVELSGYNGIPHLLSPVVTDAREAAAALRWAVKEMERRYKLFAAAGVRGIKRFNELKARDGALPYIVVIIDELADLMMVAPVDVEEAICRLAQMARAAGIHLVLATQRPSVNVITGIIKANIPSRIAFAVSSQVDSRTILDLPGAERLLGKGDMLFYPSGLAKPLRVQGAFVDDGEVEAVAMAARAQGAPEFAEGVLDGEEAGQDREYGGENDALLDDAIRLVLETGQASASFLQRRFRIGYNRAARLLELMEEMGLVGPHMGSKPREILMSAEQYYAKKA